MDSISRNGTTRGNPDGWGLAWYPDKAVQVIKEPIKAVYSDMSGWLTKRTECRSRIFVGHLRQKSGSTAEYCNTHPFSRECNGKDYVFAHNGTSKREYRGTNGYKNYLRLGRFRPIGETGSEFIFCYLLSKIEERSVTSWQNEDFKWLHNTLREVNRYFKLNCVFSDGEHLFCHYDLGRLKNLCFAERKFPFGNITLNSGLKRINFDRLKDPDQKGYIVSTEPLTREKWFYLSPGELIVVKEGVVVFQNGQNHSPVPKSSNHRHMTAMILREIRDSSDAIELEAIERKTMLDKSDIITAIWYLLRDKLIIKLTKGNSDWNNDKARFFIEPTSRSIIDGMLANS